MAGRRSCPITSQIGDLIDRNKAAMKVRIGRWIDLVSSSYYGRTFQNIFDRPDFHRNVEICGLLHCFDIDFVGDRRDDADAAIPIRRQHGYSFRRNEGENLIHPRSSVNDALRTIRAQAGGVVVVLLDELLEAVKIAREQVTGSSDWLPEFVHQSTDLVGVIAVDRQILFLEQTFEVGCDAIVVMRKVRECAAHFTEANRLRRGR